MPQLGKKAFSAMKLLPEDVPDSAKGAKTIKVLLSNLATVVQGLAEIRSLYGTGHGRDGKARGVTSRHARLAVGAASALVTFAFQTHLENPPGE
ncbi:MAG: abortive infection family protein [Erythrobacter sp.]